MFSTSASSSDMQTCSVGEYKPGQQLRTPTPRSPMQMEYILQEPGYCRVWPGYSQSGSGSVPEPRYTPVQCVPSDLILNIWGSES